ncbi:TPA: phosphoribosylanthranilate isomerase [Candidatus Poribacteria bacterium]|nr:phosphoribosylanthranilate isomerase [Candidatus Poribacteria bacterium]
MTKVKICGMTNLDDALAAVEFGADALGFVFVPNTPRYIEPAKAAGIIARLPLFVMAVGLFVNASEEHIKQVADQCKLNILQLHGQEPPDFCLRFNRKVIKAFRVKDRGSLTALPKYTVSAYLLDTYVKSAMGGTGVTFDWRLASDAKRYGPVILAGGLNPENVAKAIQQVRPYGVDVSSGVEAKPGKKDHSKLKDFIEAAKGE